MFFRNCLAASLATFLAIGVLNSNPATAQVKADPMSRKTENFDRSWKFHCGEATGADEPGFDDASWRKLDVPHDWSIEGPFDANNPAGGAGAFLPAGIGWYRKQFTLTAEEASRRIFLEFDGVMANSDVWINGFHLGHRPYGYVSFRYELTGHLDFGSEKPNLIAVRVDNSRQPASRWYAGAGIYRHVRLVTVDPVHFGLSTTWITTPSVTQHDSTIHIRSTVINQSDSARHVSVKAIIDGPDGLEAAKTKTTGIAVSPGLSIEIDQEATVHNPLLWNLEHSNCITHT